MSSMRNQDKDKLSYRKKYIEELVWSVPSFLSPPTLRRKKKFFPNKWREGGLPPSLSICGPGNVWQSSKYASTQPAITCSKLTIKTPERSQSRRFGVFIVTFEHISHLASTAEMGHQLFLRVDSALSKYVLNAALLSKKIHN